MKETYIPTVYLVIPCYNEEEVLPETVKRLTEKLQKCSRPVWREEKPYVVCRRRQ